MVLRGGGGRVRGRRPSRKDGSVRPQAEPGRGCDVLERGRGE